MIDLIRRPIFVLGAIGVILVLVFLLLSQCSSNSRKAAQERVEDSQAGAASQSSVDALETLESAGNQQVASEELTRNNEKDIRDADGANEAVKPGVRNAGRNALCLRDAYRDDPKCRVQ